ncbi:MAG: hypothetical protein KAY32_15535 [Candidatus Eisenbacteria sp.]|nr:hypothetical protein [Candidatus Eisenbacteria bacterium]
MKKLPDHRDRDAIRKTLAHDLHLAAVPTSIWLDLQDDVADYQRFQDREVWDALVEAAGDELRAPTKPKERTKDQIEVLRAKVVSLHYARLASRRPEVMTLWQETFGNDMPTERQVDELLEQIGPRYFSVQWFAEKHIPIIGHRSHVFDPTHGRNPKTLTARSVVRFRWPQQRTEVPHALALRHQASTEHCKLVLSSHVMNVLRDSVFGRVHSVASLLATQYPWDQEHAVEFLLHRKIPFASPLVATPKVHTSHDHWRVVVTIQVEPWMSPDTLQKVYRELQRQFYGKQTGPEDAQQLRLFHFVQEYSVRTHGRPWEAVAEEGLDFPWPDVARQWNKEYGDRRSSRRKNRTWRYSTPYRMRRAFMAALDRLMRAPREPYLHTIAEERQ